MPALWWRDLHWQHISVKRRKWENKSETWICSTYPFLWIPDFHLERFEKRLVSKTTKRFRRSKYGVAPAFSIKGLNTFLSLSLFLFGLFGRRPGGYGVRWDQKEQPHTIRKISIKGFQREEKKANVDVAGRTSSPRRAAFWSYGPSRELISHLRVGRASTLVHALTLASTIWLIDTSRRW